MRFTVLGSSGFIGSHLVQYLQGLGHECFCPKRDDPAMLSYQHGCIIYCIGLTADYRQRPYDAVEAHVVALAQVLEHATFDRILYLSSIRLYDSLGKILASEEISLQLSPAEPRHLYDLSKSLGENLVLNYSKGRGIVARLGCVLGKNIEEEGFVPTLLKKCFGQTGIDIESSPYFARDYIGIDDVLKLLLKIAEKGKESIYNIASGTNSDNQSLFALLNEITGCAIRASLSTRQDVPLIDITRIRTEFGFVPQPFQSLVRQIATIRGAT